MSAVWNDKAAYVRAQRVAQRTMLSAPKFTRRVLPRYNAAQSSVRAAMDKYGAQAKQYGFKVCGQPQAR